MFDTMTLTKLGAGLCGSLLVFLLGGWAAESIYGGGEGHGEGHEQSYVIAVAETGGTEAAAEEGPAFEELWAAADAAAGEAEFRPCSACHSVVAGENKTGPSLHGVVGRAPGTAPGFTYSEGFSELNAGWTPEELFHFLASPKTYDPNTAMNFNGIRNEEDRVNLIAWLATQAG
jgi:cytochrome c